jgi:hypothetical protein
MPEALVRVAERLEAGASEEECEHVLRVYAAEAKKSNGQWFNGQTNWRAENFARALGQPLGPRMNQHNLSSDDLQEIATELERRGL